MQITNNKKEQHMDMIKREEYKYTPKQGFVLTHFKTVQDVKRSAAFYLRVFGGKVIRSGEPTIIQIANSWLVLNVGGGPTDDKPTITLRTPQNENEASSFMIIRVADIWACYNEWQSRELNSLRNQKTMVLSFGAICVIRMDISSRSDRQRED